MSNIDQLRNDFIDALARERYHQLVAHANTACARLAEALEDEAVKCDLVDDTA